MPWPVPEPGTDPNVCADSLGTGRAHSITLVAGPSTSSAFMGVGWNLQVSRR